MATKQEALAALEQLKAAAETFAEAAWAFKDGYGDMTSVGMDEMMESVEDALAQIREDLEADDEDTDEEADDEEESE
jgi:Sec-independent protein translocase protein TatA